MGNIDLNFEFFTENSKIHPQCTRMCKGRSKVSVNIFWAIYKKNPKSLQDFFEFFYNYRILFLYRPYFPASGPLTWHFSHAFRRAEIQFHYLIGI